MDGNAVESVISIFSVGIVSNVYKPGNANYNVAVVIPTEQVIKVCPLLQVDNPRISNAEDGGIEHGTNTFANPWVAFMKPWTDLAINLASYYSNVGKDYTKLGQSQAKYWTDFGHESIEFWNGHKVVYKVKSISTVVSPR